jgi:hypothetical protein
MNEQIPQLGYWDLPGHIFENTSLGDKILFGLKTSCGDLILSLKKMEDHFHVQAKILCKTSPLVSSESNTHYNDLSKIYFYEGEITIWPQGTIRLGENLVIGRDMIFKLQ